MKKLCILLAVVLVFGLAHSAFAQNVQRLTYYVNGYARTANVVFFLNQEKRFYMDDGGNIVMDGRFQPSGGNWSAWEEEGIMQRRAREYVSVGGIMIWLFSAIDFYDAVELTEEGMQFILVWQKYEDDQFMRMDNRYVYIFQKIYERR